MKYIVIRNKKTDALTMHSVDCSIVKAHFGPRVSHEAINAFGSGTHAEALEAVEFIGRNTKVCKCAK
jgi:hypothetical protein